MSCVMKKSIVENIISELIEELKSQYSDFRYIYLFGSYARGEAAEDSDIDLAIVFDREIDWRFKSEVRTIVADLMVKYQYIIDALIFGIQDIIHPKEYLVFILKEEDIKYG